MSRGDRGSAEDKGCAGRGSDYSEILQVVDTNEFSNVGHVLRCLRYFKKRVVKALLFATKFQFKIFNLSAFVTLLADLIKFVQT